MATKCPALSYRSYQQINMSVVKLKPVTSIKMKFLHLQSEWEWHRYMSIDLFLFSWVPLDLTTDVNHKETLYSYGRCPLVMQDNYINKLTIIETTYVLQLIKVAIHLQSWAMCRSYPRTGKYQRQESLALSGF